MERPHTQPQTGILGYKQAGFLHMWSPGHWLHNHLESILKIQIPVSLANVLFRTLKGRLANYLYDKQPPQPQKLI